MKNRVIVSSILISVLIATSFLVSCKKDGGSPGGDDKTKSVFVQIRKQGVNTRAVGGDMSTEQLVFEDGYLIFTSGDKIVRVIEIVSGTAGDDEVTVDDLETGVEIDEVPANTKSVYIYGNLGSSLSGIETEAVVDGSISAIEALVWGLSDIQNDANDVSDVPVYGKGDVAPGTGANSNRLESTVRVYAIGSRLQIGKIGCSDAAVDELTLAGIFINGFYHSMKANSTFDAGDFVDNGIDVTKYTTTGYGSYAKMLDTFSPAVDIANTSTTPSPAGSYWAYNFFPSQMPHIVLHFATMKIIGEDAVTNRYATVAKYRTSPDAGQGAEVLTALAGNVYTLDIDITDYMTQITDLPESSSNVTGYVVIDIIDWEGNDIYPEW